MKEVTISERAFQAERIARAKVLGQDQAWHVGGTARRLVWLKQSG